MLSEPLGQRSRNKNIRSLWCLEQYRVERGKPKKNMKGMKVEIQFRLSLFEKGTCPCNVTGIQKKTMGVG